MPVRKPPAAPVPSTTEAASTAAAAPAAAPTAKAHKSRRAKWFLLGFAIVLLFTAGGAYAGYRAAIDLRKARQAEQVVTLATQHFMLGLEAQKNGQYAIAREQFEYVIAKDPSFPGAAEKLTEVLLAMAATATPTPAPTATVIPVTPTPDLRGQEEIFATARQQYAAQDWDNLMLSIDQLRSLDPGYRSIDVDGMLYVAFRFRGIRKIYQEANLEGGIYDLALAERFAPLDSDAAGARNWARLYLNGVSFWGADWGRVVDMFEQIYPYFPNLRDASGKTATERYREAAIEQGKALQNAGDGCGAITYYDKALAIVPDPALEERSAQAYLMCYPPTETPEPTVTPTATLPGDQPPPGDGTTPPADSTGEAPPEPTPNTSP